MTTRRISAPQMLYTPGATGRWLSCLTAAPDETAAGLCRLYWQRGRPIGQQPVRIESVARPAQ